MNLTQYGVWIGPRALGEDPARSVEAARLAERLGFGALWLGGSPRLTAVRPMLAATERLVVGTSIVNVWTYEPAELAAEHAALKREFPDRLLLGIGIGHPEATREYEKPMAKMRGFLDGLADAEQPPAAEEMCVAALGPKMLDLSAERTRGTIPYFTSTSHTRFARERLGPGPLVAPELACVLDTEPTSAKATARHYAGFYLGLTNYRSNLLRFEFSERDVADGGSDRLLDAVVPQGDAGQIADIARQHLAAGGDHICLQTVGTEGVPTAAWTALAAALIA